MQRFRSLFVCLVGLLVALGAAGRAEAAPDDPGPMLVRGADALDLLERGRDEMLMFRLDAAEATFERLSQAESGRAAAGLHLTKIALWRAMVLEQDALYEAFFDRSDAFLDLIDDLSDSPWKTQFRAETELYRAVIHAKKTEYARAAFALRQAYNHFEHNVSRHPTFYESAWGMGLCHTAVGLVPSQFRWVLSLMGFDGTVQQGLAEIEVSVERSEYYRDEAAIVFGLTDLIVNESKEDGPERIAALAERHPASPLVAYIHGFALLHERRAEAAETALRRALHLRTVPGTFRMPYVDYYLGEALFSQNRFEEAARYFEHYVNTFPGQALVAQAWLHLGLAREMSGDRAKALRAYRQVEAREDYDSDAAALREARERLEQPLSAQDRTLLRGRNAFDAGRYREAITTLQPVLGDADAAPAARAEAAYRSGRAYHALEIPREAIRHYQFAVSRPGDEEAKWGPWAQYYIGEVHEAEGATDAARAAYERALDYDPPFAYHKALEQRAKAALGRL